MTTNIPNIMLSGPHNAHIASIIFTDIDFIYNKLKKLIHYISKVKE
jgi:hypothetical protein